MASSSAAAAVDADSDTDDPLRLERIRKEGETCDSYVHKGLTRNVTIQFLLERLKSMGCEPPPGFIRCTDCGDKQAGGGFGVLEETILEKGNDGLASSLREDVERRRNLESCRKTDSDFKASLDAAKDGKVRLRLLPEIFLCQNHLRGETHAHESMAHELIHAIDLCRTKMDPLNNCMHMACTEIRAENLSGECSWLGELGAGRMKSFVGHGAECVKRRAALSVKANPNCRDRAEECVEAAFERCHRDTFPFDRHPNLR